jgi:hypothetical protein
MQMGFTELLAARLQRKAQGKSTEDTTPFSTIQCGASLETNLPDRLQPITIAPLIIMRSFGICLTKY